MTIDVKIAKIEEHQDRIDKDIIDLFQRFMKHMDKEELAFDKLYSRLRDMEKELGESFKQRDSIISELKMQQTKMMAYMTVAFSAMTILSQVVLKVLF